MPAPPLRRMSSSGSSSGRSSMSSSVKSSSSASVVALLGTVEARECKSLPVEPGGTTAAEVTPSDCETGRVFTGGEGGGEGGEGGGGEENRP